MAIETPKTTSQEAPKYSILDAKKDIFTILTAENFQSPEVDQVLGRLLESKKGLYLTLFLSHSPNISETVNALGVLKPLVEIIKAQNYEAPSEDEYPQYMEVAQALNDQLNAHFKGV